MAKPSILIVEDESIIALHIQKILISMEYTVVDIISSGEEVIKLLENVKPDLILMDIMLEGEMDGIKTTEIINSIYDIPVVYLTAHSDEKTLTKVKNTNPYGYIIKPINNNDLNSTIEIAVHKHRIEKKLKEREEVYRNLVESINDIAFSIDENTIFTFIGPQIEDISGYSIFELLGRNFLDFIFEADKNFVQDILTSHELQQIECEFRFVSKSQSLKWFRISGKPLFIESKFNGLRGIISNITERKQAEQGALHRRERIERHQNAITKLATMSALFEGTFAHSTKIINEIAAKAMDIDRVCIWIISEGKTQLTCIDVYDRSANTHSSGTILNIHDYPNYFETIENMRAIDAIDATKDSRTKEFADTYLIPNNITSMLNSPIRLHGKLAGIVSFEHTGDKRSWTGDEVSFASEIADHLTQLLVVQKKKQAELALLESEKKFSHLIEASPVAIVIIGENEKIIYINQKFINNFGYTLDEIPDLHAWWNQAYPSEKHRQQVIERWYNRLKTAQDQYSEFTDLEESVSCKDGSIKYIEFKLSIIGKLFFIILNDITERKIAEQEITSKNEQLLITNEKLIVYQNELKSRESMLNSILRVIPTGIGIVKERIVQWSNTMIFTMLGYDEDELIGKNARMIYPTEEEFKRVGEEINEQIEIYGTGTVETKWKKKDGTIMDVLLSNTPLNNENHDEGLTFTALDITARKRALKTVKEREKELRKAQKMAHVGSWVWNIKFNTFQMSEEMKEIYGVDSEHIYHNLTELTDQYIHPDDKEIFHEIIKKITSGKPGENITYRIIRNDQSIRWINAIAPEIKIFENGTPEVLIGTVQDITELKKTEAMLNESRERFINVFQQSPLSLEIFDLQGNQLQANHAWFGLMGIENYNEKLTYNIFDDPNFQNKLIKDDIEKAFTGEIVEFIDLEYNPKLLNYNGSLKYLRSKFYPIKDNVGLIKNLVVTHEDISETKKYEKELFRLVTAIDQADEDIFITDIEGAIQYVNPAFERTTGYTKDESIGQNPRFLKSGKHDDQFYKTLWDTLTSGNVWKNRITNMTKAGNFIIQDATISPIRDKKNSIIGFVSVKRDVTEQVQLESQLAQAQKMEAIGTLAGGLAHDFNNVLGGIIGSLDLLQILLDKEDLSQRDKIWKYLEIAQEASNSATDMIKQLLTLSRKQELKFAPVNINLSLKHVMKICKTSFPKSVILKFIFSEKPLYINADPTQIEQVLLNLCVNASHAMTIMRKNAIKEGGLLTISAENSYADDTFIQNHRDAIIGTSYIKIVVQDDGIGMDEETKKRIFEPFYTTKDRDVGTGLGLSMVYSIIKQHNGFIDVASELNVGTSFYIFIPELIRTSGIMAEDSIEKRITRGSGTILIIDDETLMLSIAEEMIKEIGYDVLTTDTGDKGIEIFKEHIDIIDAVILDMSMPGKSGLEVFEILKSIKSTIKVLLTSGFPQDDRVKKAIEMGMSGFIQKPFSAPELSKKLDEIINNT